MSAEPLPERSHITGDGKNRIAELEAPFFAALALKNTFSGSEEAFVVRENTYHGLPTHLTYDEVVTLSDHLAKNLEGMPVHRVYEAQGRALGWLGAVSVRHQDVITAESVSRVLQDSPQLKPRPWLFRLTR